MDSIYLDHNATTPLAAEALEAMLPFLSGTYAGGFGNPSSIHATGRDARAAIDDSRERLAQIFGGRPHELIFTGGGTEADNLAVIGISRNRVRTGAQRHLIVAQTEHHAVLHAAQFLEKSEGFRLTWLRVDGGGLVDLEELRQAITPQTALVSVMSANNETGTLQPVVEIGAICREHGVPFHSDMVQSFGKIPLPSDRPDAISIAAHKFYGPKGTGALWLRSGYSIDPILFGGSHENDRRAGTENVAGIVGLVAAAELAHEGMEQEQARQATLTHRLWQGVQAAFPTAVRNGSWETPAQQLANTLDVSFPGLDGEALLINFDLEGIAVSSGSACMVGSIQPSHVLLAMGVPPENAAAAVRFSLGKGTTEEAIEEVIGRLPRIVGRLRA